MMMMLMITMEEEEEEEEEEEVAEPYNHKQGVVLVRSLLRPSKYEARKTEKKTVDDIRRRIQHQPGHDVIFVPVRFAELGTQQRQTVMDNDLHRPAIALPTSSLSTDESDIEARIQRGPPTSAEDYILRVRHEAKKLPDVFQATPEQLAKFRRAESSSQKKQQNAKNRSNHSSTTTTTTANTASGTHTTTVTAVKTNSEQRSWTPTAEGFAVSRALRIADCPPSLEPSSVWQNTQLQLFDDLRQYLSDPRSTNPQENTDKLPGRSDEKGWMMKCVGSYMDSDGEVQSAGSPGTAPTASFLLRINNATCARLLQYHIRALVELNQDPQQGIVTACRAVWIYALLARIHKPISPEVGGLIRELLRLCCAIRYHLQNADAVQQRQLSVLNLLILLARSYFGQG